MEDFTDEELDGDFPESPFWDDAEYAREYDRFRAALMARNNARKAAALAFAPPPTADISGDDDFGDGDLFGDGLKDDVDPDSSSTDEDFDPFADDEVYVAPASSIPTDDSLLRDMAEKMVAGKLQQIFVEHGIPAACTFFFHAGLPEEEILAAVQDMMSKWSVAGMEKRPRLGSMLRSSIGGGPYPEGFLLRDWRERWAAEVSAFVNETWWRPLDRTGMPDIRLFALLPRQVAEKAWSEACSLPDVDHSVEHEIPQADTDELSDAGPLAAPEPMTSDTPCSMRSSRDDDCQFESDSDGMDATLREVLELTSKDLGFVSMDEFRAERDLYDLVYDKAKRYKWRNRSIVGRKFSREESDPDNILRVQRTMLKDQVKPEMTEERLEGVEQRKRAISARNAASAQPPAVPRPVPQKPITVPQMPATGPQELPDRQEQAPRIDGDHTVEGWQERAREWLARHADEYHTYNDVASGIGVGFKPVSHALRRWAGTGAGCSPDVIAIPTLDDKGKPVLDKRGKPTQKYRHCPERKGMLMDPKTAPIWMEQVVRKGLNECPGMSKRALRAWCRRFLTQVGDHQVDAAVALLVNEAAEVRVEKGKNGQASRYFLTGIGARKMFRFSPPKAKK